jgi:hypothetical protein
MKYEQNIKLGDAHVTPRNIQEVQASKLGDAPWHPLLHRQKYQVIFIFCFHFSFVLFAAINGWTPAYFFWRRHTPFTLPRTL